MKWLRSNLQSVSLSNKTIQAFVLKLLSICLSYLLAIVISRSFGAESYGRFTTSMMIINIGAAVGLVGLSTVFLRIGTEKIANDRLDVAKGMMIKSGKFVLATTVFIASMIFIIAQPLSSTLFKDVELTSFIKIASLIIIPYALLKLCLESFRSTGRTSTFLLFNPILLSFLTILLIIAAGYFNLNEEYTVMAYGASGVLLLFIVIVTMLPNQVFKGAKADYSIALKTLLAIGLPLMLAESFNLIKGWVDTFMINIYLSSAELGVYTAGLKLSKFLAVPLTTLNVVYAPRFARSFGMKNISELKFNAQKTTLYSILITTPIFLLIFLFPELLLSVFGDEFESGKWVLKILVIGGLVNAAVGPVGVLLQMTNNQKSFQNITLVTLVIGILINMILIPRFGLNGAAISTILINIFWNLACFITIKRKLGFYTIGGFKTIMK